MGRREEPITGVGPVPQFAQALRELRRDSGNLSYADMVRHRGARCSRSALSTAARGETLPTWPITREYVRACGGDEDKWQIRWEEVSGGSDPPEPERLVEPKALYKYVPPRRGGPVIVSGGDIARIGADPWSPPRHPGTVPFGLDGGRVAGGYRSGPGPVPESAETMKEFGRLLNVLRTKASRLTVRELEKATGIPRSTLNDVLTGERAPSSRMTDLIVRACGADDVYAARWEAAFRRLAAYEYRARIALEALKMPVPLNEEIAVEYVSRRPDESRSGVQNAWARPLVALVGRPALVTGFVIVASLLGGLLVAAVEASTR